MIRDFIGMNLYELNLVLGAVGFQKTQLQNIYDFNLDAFIRFIKNVQQEQHATILQKLLIQYYNSCGRRVPPGSPKIVDYQPKVVCLHTSI